MSNKRKNQTVGSDISQNPALMYVELDIELNEYFA